MGKFFPASAKHAKTREFLELRHGTMTVIQYVTVHPGQDYGTSPIRYGLYGQDNYGYRERD